MQGLFSPWQVKKGRFLPPELLSEAIALAYSWEKQEEVDGGVQGGQKEAQPTPKSHLVCVCGTFALEWQQKDTELDRQGQLDGQP